MYKILLILMVMFLSGCSETNNIMKQFENPIVLKDSNNRCFVVQEYIANYTVEPIELVGCNNRWIEL